MKLFKKEKKSNKLLFSISIIACFGLFMFITVGNDKFPGIVAYIDSFFDGIYDYTYYGKQFVHEVFWLICLLPVLLMFGNKYVFTQKRTPFFKSLTYAWPIVIYICFNLLRSTKEIGTVSNPLEILAIALLCVFIGIFEELLCRGWLMNEFIERFGDTRKNILFSIIISSLVFGLIHFGNIAVGQSLLLTLSQVLGAALIGLALGAIYYKTKNIWTVAFLHGFWDFAVFFGEVNVGVECVSPSVGADSISTIMAAFMLIQAVFTSLPCIGNALLLLGKDDLNEGLERKNQEKITREDRSNIYSFRKTLSIVIILFLIAYGFIVNSVTKVDSICPEFINSNDTEYSVTHVTKDSYKVALYPSGWVMNCPMQFIDGEPTNCLPSSSVIYELTLNEDHKVEVKNNDSSIVLDYDYVDQLAVFDNDDYYSVIILTVNDDGDGVAYYSDHLKYENSGNGVENLNNFKASFKQIVLPSIKWVGYFEKFDDTYKYPLFVSEINKYYTLSREGTIYKHD